MKIIYRNYIVEDDRSGFILTTIGKVAKGEKAGEDYVKDVIYPSTLENCFDRIIKGQKLDKDEEVDLKKYIETYKELKDEFMKEIKVELDKLNK